MTDPVMLLSQVHGEGRLTFHALRAAGFVSLVAVAETPLHVLADRAHLSLQTARKLKKGAEGMIENSVVSAEAPPAPGRRSSGGRGRPVSFSQGVSLEEAELLGQGYEGAPAGDPPGPPDGLEEPGQDDAAQAPAPAEALPEPGKASIAAAAEVASGLRRAADQGKKTFWAFG